MGSQRPTALPGSVVEADAWNTAMHTIQLARIARMTAWNIVMHADEGSIIVWYFGRADKNVGVPMPYRDPMYTSGHWHVLPTENTLLQPLTVLNGREVLATAR